VDKSCPGPVEIFGIPGHISKYRGPGITMKKLCRKAFSEEYSCIVVFYFGLYQEALLWTTDPNAAPAVLAKS